MILVKFSNLNMYFGVGEIFSPFPSFPLCYLFWLLDHTQLFSGVTPSSMLRNTPDGVQGTSGILGIKAGLTISNHLTHYYACTITLAHQVCLLILLILKIIFSHYELQSTS